MPESRFRVSGGALVHHVPIVRRSGTPTTQVLRSGRLAGIEWRDLVELTPLETARELTLCLPWLALSLAFAARHLYLPALAASFMMFLTGLRQVHNGHHHALGLGRRANEWFLFAMSVVMLGAMHAVKFNHLRHHKLCMGEGDVEAASARMSGWRAIAFGPLFPLLLHRTALAKGNRRVRLWICAELAANVAWIAAVFLWLRVDALRYHVIAMGVAQCLTAFFAVWTVHHDTEGAAYPARTQRGWLRNFLSYHMFRHVEHHLFPQVPTCHLPALARRLDRAMPELSLRQVWPSSRAGRWRETVQGHANS
jgi:fatty acid desaturase